MYDSGRGVKQDYIKAKELYEKAANQGNTKAQFNLGGMYYDGHGVRQNKKIAKEWFGKACDGGDQIGCDNYKILNQQGY
ncbi:tetratricopeptide repeat protein [Aliarcobacter cryaerophilus]|uniref:tetratricopeptide repeat protein n=1 Tax=Aliarcobacter cryaerophilus TaxID=28198 RepID=UPI0019CFF27B|nr:tetratricopeptide repeat protein [Aliarcobacter cryaerophilus]